MSDGAETPATLGYTRTVVFGEDGFVEHFRDGELFRRQEYRVYPAVPGEPASAMMITYGDAPTGYVGTDEEWLRIDFDRIDAGESLYRRIQTP